MNNRILIALIITGLLCPEIGWGRARKNKPQAAAAAQSPQIIYEGKIIDENGKPLGGIYPLTFELYKSARGGKALWSESHYVAVENGEYHIKLGKKTVVPDKLSLEKLYIAVSLTNEGEIIRERLTLQEVDEEDTAAPASAPPTTSTPTGSVTAAQQADFAAEAEHAINADKVGGLTVDEIIKKAREGVKVKLGKRIREGGSRGGPGGDIFDDRCPPGWVMSGMNIRAGRYVDSVQIVCSPFE